MAMGAQPAKQFKFNLTDEQKAACGDPPTAADMAQEGFRISDWPNGWEARYTFYTPCKDLSPVPPFPCTSDPLCTSDNRICHRHKYVIFCKVPETPPAAGYCTFEVPFGNWECTRWYKERLAEKLGGSPNQYRFIFAGSEQDDLNTHSGLQYQSTYHCIPNKNFIG